VTRDPEPKAPTPATTLARSLTDPAFLAAVCHDLRGPLGAIGTWINVLGSGRADATTREQALAAIKRDVSSQGRLIEQLDALSSILGGTLPLRMEEVELAAVLQELGAKLHADVPSIRVRADPKRLRQLLAILLPVKQGADAEGHAPVLTASQEGPDALLIRGSVRKDGPGILGLTLARALAELQGGRLTTSAAAQTTTFTIQLAAP
jgi:signal transduction histidine kinase